MANQQRLADNLNRYALPRRGTPWRFASHCCKVLLFAAAAAVVWGCVIPAHTGSYPVYVCRADQHQHGGPRCQEVTALGVDAAIERLLLEALTPDRLALAIAALGELDVELENQPGGTVFGMRLGGQAPASEACSSQPAPRGLPSSLAQHRTSFSTFVAHVEEFGQVDIGDKPVTFDDVGLRLRHHLVAGPRRHGPISRILRMFLNLLNGSEH